jgi:hypothetical protein
MIITWQTMPGPLALTEQATIILEFDHQAECLSIADQVTNQIKRRQVPLTIKRLSCLECTSLYGKERCTPPATVLRKR